MDFIERTNSKLVRCHTLEASRSTGMKKTNLNRTNKNTPDQIAQRIKVSVNQRLLLKKHAARVERLQCLNKSPEQKEIQPRTSHPQPLPTGPPCCQEQGKGFHSYLGFCFEWW